LSVFSVQFSLEAVHVGSSINNELFSNSNLFFSGIQLSVQISQLVVSFINGGSFFSHVSFEISLSLFFRLSISDHSGSHVISNFVQFVDNSLDSAGISEFVGSQGNQSFDEVFFDISVFAQFFSNFVQSFFGFSDLNEGGFTVLQGGQQFQGFFDSFQGAVGFFNSDQIFLVGNFSHVSLVNHVLLSFGNESFSIGN